MDNGIIKTESLQNGRVSSQEKLQTSRLDTARGVLQKWTPAQFLEVHNPDVGTAIVREGYTCGHLALNESVPTLANVAEEYGDATVIAWLRIQLDAVDRVLGAKAMGELERYDAARLIYAKYRDMNVANLLQFFARYRLGEYAEATERIAGVQKILTALKLYNVTCNDDARRLEREREMQKGYEQRLEWEKKAVSYEEWLKTRDNE